MVSWEEIPQVDRNGIIIRYDIMYSYPRGGGLVNNTKELFIVLTGLAESESYTIQVRGATSAGLGPYSDPVSEMTNEDSKFISYHYKCAMHCIMATVMAHTSPSIYLIFPAPEQVGKPQVVDEGTLTSTSAQLQWAPPEDPNGVITEYLINVEALSTNPGAFMMGMGTGMGGGNDRRKRQTPAGVNMACILGEVNVTKNITIQNDDTEAHRLNDLSE